MTQSTSNDIAVASTQRYTLDGSDDVERLIASHQRFVARSVRNALGKRHFATLVIIGSYARGEGGYRYRDGQPEPYNDYDYFVVVKGASRRVARRLQGELTELAETLGEAVGVEVDLAILRQETLPNSPATLMFAEMLQGHRILAGDRKILTQLPPMPLDTLSLGEFTRLMLNRGALLLINQQVLATGDCLSEPAREQFLKYSFKAILACGDAYLAMRGLYHPLYQCKWTRLKSIENYLPRHFLDLYAHALEAEFHPDYGRFALINLSAHHLRVVQVWLEAFVVLEEMRLGHSLTDWSSYASPAVSKGQSGQSVRSVLRNLAITLRDYGPAELLANLAWSARYPRERLISVLPVLLGDRKAADETRVRQALAMITGGSDTVEQAFLSQWHRYA